MVNYILKSHEIYSGIRQKAQNAYLFKVQLGGLDYLQQIATQLMVEKRWEINIR